MKDKKKKKPNPFRFGCLITIIVVIGLLASVGIFIYKSYERAEIQNDIKKAQEKYLTSIKTYKNFSNKEVKELSIKLYLLDECEGGKETIKFHVNVDNNAKANSCDKLLKDNIRKENLPKFQNELEKLKYINNLKFGSKSLKYYQDFLSN